MSRRLLVWLTFQLLALKIETANAGKYSRYTDISQTEILQRVDFYLDPYDDEQGACPSTNNRILSFTGHKFPNLEKIPQLNVTQLQQLRVQGMWILYDGQDYTINQSVSMSAVGRKTWWCEYNKKLPLQVKSLRFLGNPDASLPGLSLLLDYSAKLNSAGPEVYVETATEDFVTPLSIVFWALTGNQNWSIYPEKNFQGKPICLVTMNMSDIFYNSGSLSPPVVVGSVKEDCLDDNA